MAEENPKPLKLPRGVTVIDCSVKTMLRKHQMRGPFCHVGSLINKPDVTDAMVAQTRKTFVNHDPSDFVGIDLFRVVEPRERPHPAVAQRGVVEEDACDDERAGEGASPGLVRTGDEARLEATIESEQALARGERHAPRISSVLGRDRAVPITAS